MSHRIAVLVLAGGPLYDQTVEAIRRTWGGQSLPQLDGESAGKGLGAAVEIVRDAEGVPHVFARSERDGWFAMGYSHDDMRVWNPRLERGGLSEADLKSTTFLLWKGHCSVHQRFRPEHVAAFRAEHPDGIVIAHPETSYEVCQLADVVGSTDAIIKAVEAAPAGSTIGVATEIHLVQRLDEETPDKTVVCLDPLICPCSTMFRIDPKHLAWVLENLVAGTVVNRITVDAETAEWAKVALDRMLSLPGTAAVGTPKD